VFVEHSESPYIFNIRLIPSRMNRIAVDQSPSRQTPCGTLGLMTGDLDRSVALRHPSGPVRAAASTAAAATEQDE